MLTVASSAWAFLVSSLEPERITANTNTMPKAAIISDINSARIFIFVVIFILSI